MHKIGNRMVRRGNPEHPGVTGNNDGMNLAVYFPEAQEVILLLYRSGEEAPSEEINMVEFGSTGEVYAVYLPDFTGEGYEYNYKVDGRVVQDPCAAVIRGKGAFGSLPDTEHPHGIRCGFPRKDYDWGEDVRPDYNYSDMIMYKLHVRGYTRQKNSRVRHKGTFAGIVEKIPYFKELGINTLEFMPVYDFNEVIMPENLPLEYACRMSDKIKTNFWGYAPGNYYAPKPAYASGKDADTEMKDMVKALHAAGIQCILEFYFPGGYNELKALLVLRYWYLVYHVDGFHLVGDGAPVSLIRQDPLLKKARLMFVNPPGDQGDYADRPARRYYAEYNEGFKQDIRRFLKSDEDSLENALMRMRRNPGACGVINYITNQDGFTLMDLVSYDAKHNEANGEENQDGTSYNFSWNCGVEGPTRRPAVRKLRQQQMRNAFAFLLLSQGVPMIYGGDEFGNSQQGNNNAYCQDNETGWVDWRAQSRNKDMLQFVKSLIAFRREHRVFCQEQELRMMDYQSTGYPDLSYHSNRAWYAQYDNISRYVGLMYCGDYTRSSREVGDSFFYVAYNFHWEPHEFALPNLPEKSCWKRIMSTSRESLKSIFTEEPEVLKEQKMVEVAPRSIEIFIGIQEKK